jgi:hypothetical protein
MSKLLLLETILDLPVVFVKVSAIIASYPNTYKFYDKELELYDGKEYIPLEPSVFRNPVLVDYQLLHLVTHEQGEIAFNIEKLEGYFNTGGEFLIQNLGLGD